MVLDDLDRRLLRLLQADARQSFRTLARATGSTVPTVSSRIRRMESLQIIQGYTVRLDPTRFGAEAASVPAIDLDAPVNVPCHTCRRHTTDPVLARVDGRRHPFCCTTCRDTFQGRHRRLAEGL